MSRLIFINRFYWPEEPATSQLLTDLAQGLTNLGHDVSIITSRPQNASVPRWERRHGVHITRLGSSRFGANSLLGRALDFLSFTLGTAGQLLTATQRGDTVIFLTDPPLLGALLWPILTLKNIRFVHWIQDIYPEIACELTNQRWLKIARPWRNLSWRCADHCITLGEDMARVVAINGVSPQRLKIIPNWPPVNLNSQTTPTEIDRLKQQWGLRNKFVALYSGNLGRVHDLSPLISVAEQLRAETDIVFAFIGQGAQLRNLQNEVARRGLRNVFFFPPQPREQLHLTLSLGDVHFVTLRENCVGYVYPSKLYGIAAVARPVVFIGPRDSALSQTIQSQEIGFSFSPGDIDEIASALLALKNSPERQNHYRRSAMRFASTHDFHHAQQAWHETLSMKSSLAAN